MLITGWGVATGHLPLAPTSQADTSVVSLYADGQKKILTTDSGTVRDVLARAGVTLSSGDLVEPSLSTKITPGFFNVNVYRARPVTVVDQGQEYHLNSAYSSPRLLAEAAGLTVYPEDRYTTQVVTNFVDQNLVGVKITVLRSMPFNVIADGKTVCYRAQPSTVEQAFSSEGVKLGLQDEVSVPLDSALLSGESVTIHRVTTVVTTVNEPIAPTVQTVSDPNQPVGYRAVTQQGVPGSQEVTYRIHYQDGTETAREKLKVGATVAAKAQIVTVGTKVLYAGSVEYWRPLVIQAANQYGIDPNRMMRIMSCESTGNAFASNGNHFGLYQYLRTTWYSAGGSDSNIFDGATQISLTARYMSEHGFGAWQCQ